MTEILSTEDRDGLLVEVGKLIKEARKIRQVTQAELARRLNTTQSVVSRLEIGKHGPSIMTLYRIAKVLNAPLTDLIPKNL